MGQKRVLLQSLKTSSAILSCLPRTHSHRSSGTENTSCYARTHPVRQCWSIWSFSDFFVVGLYGHIYFHQIHPGLISPRKLQQWERTMGARKPSLRKDITKIWNFRCHSHSHLNPKGKIWGKWQKITEGAIHNEAGFRGFASL